MKTNIFTLCDFAKEYNGQLNITGTFSCIHSAMFPTAPINFSLACQFEIKAESAGEHFVSISVRNKATGDFLIQPQELKLDVQKNPVSDNNDRLYSNLIINFDRMIFQAPGTYTIELISDGNKEDIELYIRNLKLPSA